MAPLLSSFGRHLTDLSCPSCPSLKQKFIDNVRHASHFLTAALGTQIALSRPHQSHNGAGRQLEEKGKLGAVTSENVICTNIGINLLKAGGNAADALVGTVLCVGTIGMYHSGIGGGGFMLVRSSDGAYEHIDFREAAPAAAFENMYEDNVNGSIWTGLASGVPGELRGLEYLHKKYGQLPWRDVIMPAVNVSRYGFRVSEDFQRFMDFVSPTDGRFLVRGSQLGDRFCAEWQETPD